MARFIRQSSTSTLKVGPFVSPSDGLTPFTTGGFTVKLAAAGGAAAARHDATAITHDADGYYSVEIDATDSATIGRLRLTVAGSAGNYLPVWDDFVVLAQVVYDVLFGSTAPSTFAGGAVASVTGNVGGNVVGSVASVTGAVGSVSGAVGSVTGNVGGSVGSVVGNVGGNVVGNVVGSVASVTGNVGGNVVGSVASVTAVSAGAIASTSFATGCTIPRVTLADTVTTYTGDTPQTGDVFALLNPMITSHVYTSAALVNAPSGGGGGITITDVQTAMTNQGYTTTRAPKFDSIPTPAAGVSGGLPVLPSTLVLPANVTKWGGQGGGIAVDTNTNRPLVNIVGSASTLATSNGMERLAWLLSPNDGSSLDDGVVLPDQTGMTTTQVKLSASANSANVRPGYVLTMKSGTQLNKGRHITSFDGTTKIITINTAWTTNPAAGDTFRIDPPPKANVGGYNTLQSPDYYLLTTPGQTIATDASHNVSVNLAALVAAVWPDGTLTINDDGSVQSNLIDINGVAVTIEDIIADVVTALTNYGAAKTTDLTAIAAVTAKLATMLQAVGGNSQFTIQALAQAPAGGGGGGLLGTTPLTFATQIGNTTPTVMSALSILWASLAGSEQANAIDPTKTDLLAPDGTTILFTYDAPTRVQLTDDALDLIMAETTAGINMRQAVQLILAMAVGQLSGAGTGTLSITGANVAIERVRCVGDSLGNRTQVTITFDN